MDYFVDVILPLPLEKSYTYALSSEEASEISIGSRVVVPFGKSKLYTALVVKIHQDKPEIYEAKLIYEILDSNPIVTLEQLNHWSWIANYYMCSLGEVYKMAIPSALLLSSETHVQLHSDIHLDISELSDDEYLIVEALEQQNGLSIKDVISITNRKNVMPIIQGLIKKKQVDVVEQIRDKYVLKYEKLYYINFDLSEEALVKESLQVLKNAKKQRELFLLLCQNNASIEQPMSEDRIKEKMGLFTTYVKPLLAKEFVGVVKKEKNRIQFDKSTKRLALKQLNKEQEVAFEKISKSISNNRVCLLQGVTSSGKTEVYAKLIKECLDSGKQVLYLLPEIALTVQLIRRMQEYFGEAVTVFHSKYNNQERVEVWNQVLNGASNAQLIIGARSSLFLPFKKLGLIVVDEEHERSYKQFDPAPRYHARDASIYLAALSSCGVVLGSATPSIESRYNVAKGKYDYAELLRRHENLMMPEIQLIDLKKHHKKKEMKGHFSAPLLEEIDRVIEENKQIILFQNRRGYAPLLECEQCGHTPQCPNCDVSLTYHQHTKELRCHYCGHSIPFHSVCEACGSMDLNSKGLGTEQVVHELVELRPQLSVERLDFDTTRKKNAYDDIIGRFENHEIDVLVGTQMVSKGLDFKKVALVGVMNADSLLNFPDYTAHERAFQMLAQVAGRSGRADERGKVFIQTYNPYHEILRQVSENDYEGMYKEQSYQREIYHYPPSNRLIKISFKHREYNKINESAAWFSQGLREQIKGVQVLGPEFPVVARVRNEYVKHIILKIPKQLKVSEVKKYLRRLYISFHSVAAYRPVRVQFHVDYI